MTFIFVSGKALGSPQEADSELDEVYANMLPFTNANRQLLLHSSSFTI